MSLMKNLDLKNLGAGVASRPAPEMILEGDPCFTTWSFMESPVQVGVWAGTPGVHKMARDSETWEEFHILEGEVEITENGQSPRRFGAGDVVIIEPNFKGTWRTIAAIKKVYVSMKR